MLYNGIQQGRKNQLTLRINKMNYGDQYSDYQFDEDSIQHLDLEVLMEFFGKFTILINAFTDNEMRPPEEIIQIHKTLRARLVSCKILTS